MNKWFELLIGLIFVTGPVYIGLSNLWGLGDAALNFLKGGLVWFFVMLGLLFLMLGISDLKD
jgi:hypothetical protein